MVRLVAQGFQIYYKSFMRTAAPNFTHRRNQEQYVAGYCWPSAAATSILTALYTSTMTSILYSAITHTHYSASK